jgi:hypothetical protein
LSPGPFWSAIRKLCTDIVACVAAFTTPCATLDFGAHSGTVGVAVDATPPAEHIIFGVLGGAAVTASGTSVHTHGIFLRQSGWD